MTVTLDQNGHNQQEGEGGVEGEKTGPGELPIYEKRRVLKKNPGQLKASSLIFLTLGSVNKATRRQMEGNTTDADGGDTFHGS